MARSTQVAARERARAVRRKLTAQRAERDKKIEEAAAGFFSGQDLVDQGTLAMQDAVQVLHGEIGESTENIAELLEIPTKQVTRLRREATQRAEASTSTADDGEATPPPEAAAS